MWFGILIIAFGIILFAMGIVSDVKASYGGASIEGAAPIIVIVFGVIILAL